jgi:hypothetical protein
MSQDVPYIFEASVHYTLPILTQDHSLDKDRIKLGALGLGHIVL